MSSIVHRIAPAWQKSLQNLITKPQELIERLNLNIELLPAAERAAQLFPLRVTEHYLQQIKIGDINDPLLKQILPLEAELTATEGFHNDPLAEHDNNPIPGLLHKYQSRVLLTITQSCAIHCRYCFRKNFPYQDNNPGRKGWSDLCDYIKNSPEINEVIYSGGDPLSASDEYLLELTNCLAQLPQLQRLRIHTRMPLLIPERVCDTLITWLTKYPNLKPIVIIHCNHPQEISAAVITAIKKLTSNGIMVLNQSVLLKGINDAAEILIKLSETLFAANVLPYYLHLLDRVTGTAHFEVTAEDAMILMRELNRQLPGYLVPKLVREIPGQPAKTIIQ